MQEQIKPVISNGPGRLYSVQIPAEGGVTHRQGHHCVPLGCPFGALTVIVFQKGRYATRTTHNDA
jgi:hypothetical protein